MASIRASVRYLILIVFCVGALFANDLRVKTRTSETASSVPDVFGLDETIYVQGSVQRTEFLGYVEYFQPQPGQKPPHMAIISHCDSGVSYQVDLDHQEYRMVKMPKYPSEKEFAEQVQAAKKQADRYKKSNTVDTGQTQDFYGHTAKHLVTTITEKSDYTHSEETVDGWYLDLPRPGCAPAYLRWGKLNDIGVTHISGLGPGIGGAYVGISSDMLTIINPRISSPTSLAEIAYTGNLPGGLAIQSKSRVHQTLIIQGRKQEVDRSIEREILEYAEEPLEPSLFEVPAGFTKVDHLYRHIKNANN